MRRHAEVFRYEELLWAGKEYRNSESEYVGTIGRIDPQQFTSTLEEMRELFFEKIKEFRRGCDARISVNSENINFFADKIRESNRSISQLVDEVRELNAAKFPLDV